MGGFGSGRTAGMGYDTVESCRSIDMNRLHQEGCLSPAWQGGWQWSCNGECVYFITMRMEYECLVLSYRMCIDSGDWEHITERVSIVRAPCRLGGSWPYFLCPGVGSDIACKRRVTKLYGASRYFLCRHCYCLVYASQGEGALERALRRANKIRMRLGGDPDMEAPYPDRPRGMWRRTYERLLDGLTDAEEAANEFHAVRAERLLDWLTRHA
jgi:hypothetical protein